MFVHVLDTRSIELVVFEAHDSVANKNALEVDIEGVAVVENLCGQVGNVFTGITFSSKEEGRITEVLELVAKKILQCSIGVCGGARVVVAIVTLLVDAVAHTCRRLKKQDVSVARPSKRVASKLLSYGVVVTNNVGTDLMKHTQQT
jgi:hypothetical protein